MSSETLASVDVIFHHLVDHLDGGVKPPPPTTTVLRATDVGFPASAWRIIRN
ncbi:hypothetical protein K9857_01545 [Pseudomonas sp. REP124]|uniref:hypothetical protein n=1 Tax=Pseudomonas sp. REP124 TaxID=2875731 RepID=UPI001CCE040C|nr:hypothetical protein [Pseudomonas sp. REP124]MBZ9780236.1 hypothetical protein [Pseudomonas sp. REP124]